PPPIPPLFPYTTLFRSLDYSPSSTTVILIVSLTLRRTETPDVAVLAFLSPAGFITMHNGACSYPCFDGVCGFLYRLCLCNSVQRSEEHTSELQSLAYLV